LAGCWRAVEHFNNERRKKINSLFQSGSRQRVIGRELVRQLSNGSHDITSRQRCKSLGNLLDEESIKGFRVDSKVHWQATTAKQNIDSLP